MFLELATQQVVSAQQVRAMLPDVNLPFFISIADVAQYGYGQIVNDTSVKPEPGFKLVEAGYVETGGNYVMSYTQALMTEQEMLDDLSIQNSANVLTQQRLDAFAKPRGYDNIAYACTYTTSTVPRFKADADYCIIARDATWTVLYALFEDITNNVPTAPKTVTEVLARLPVLSWPI